MITEHDIEEVLATADRVEFRVFNAYGDEDLSVILRGKAIEDMRKKLKSWAELIKGTQS